MTKKSDQKIFEREFNILKDFNAPTFEEWKEKVLEDLKGKPFEKIKTNTYEGIELQPIYTQKDSAGLSHLSSFPGYSPFLRGADPGGYLNKKWEICQGIYERNPEKFNRALSKEIVSGTNAIAFSLLPENKTYLKIGNMQDLSTAFNGIDISQYPIYVRAGFTSLPGISLLQTFFDEKKIDKNKIRGSIEADPIGVLLTNGKLPVNFDEIFDQMASALRWSRQNLPLIKTIGVDGSIYADSGASAVHELAFTFASAVEYINQLIQRGFSIDLIAQNIRFTLGVGSNYFMEIAKLRAARVLWTNIIDAFGGSETSKKMLIHGKTNNLNQTIIDPHVNILRETTEAFSAIIGGIDSLETTPFDAIYAPSNNFSRRIAKNIQIVLSEESNLSRLIDPAGGSFYIEKLTHEIAALAWDEFKKIEKMGGMIEAVRSGYLHSQIKNTIDKKVTDLKIGKLTLVGTNKYVNPKEKINYPNRAEADSLPKKPDKLTAQQAETLREFSEAPTDKKMKFGIAAAKAGISADLLYENLSLNSDNFESAEKLKLMRLAEPFEDLRLRTDSHLKKTGSKPKVFLATIGPLKQFKARADFARGFFETGGFEVIYPDGFKSTNEAADAAINSGAEITVICSTDDTYPDIIPPLTLMIKSKNKNTLVLAAGNPANQVDDFTNIGLDGFIFLGANIFDVLSNLLSRLGV